MVGGIKHSYQFWKKININSINNKNILSISSFLSFFFSVFLSFFLFSQSFFLSFFLIYTMFFFFLFFTHNQNRTAHYLSELMTRYNIRIHAWIRLYISKTTLTDYMFQEKREEEDLPALKTALTYQYNDSKTIYKNAKKDSLQQLKTMLRTRWTTEWQ